MHGPRRPLRTILAIALFAATVVAIGPNPQTIAAEKTAPDATPREQPVNLNTADAKRLSTHPGFGAIMARRIIEFR